MFRLVKPTREARRMAVSEEDFLRIVELLRKEIGAVEGRLLVAMRTEIDHSANELYKRIENGALGEIRKDIATLRDGIASMKVDLAYVKDRVAGSEEIAVINENIQALRDHAGI